MLLYLPLAHNFGRLMHLTGAYVGYTIAFLPDPLQTAEALLTVQPTVLPSVPRVYEKIHTAVVAAMDETTGVKRHLADWSLAVGREVGKAPGGGQPVGAVLKLKAGVADRLVFKKIRARLGGRLRTPISGGAPLGQEMAEFFDAIGVRIFEGYGLSECTTAATTNTPERWRFGTVGPALPGFELRIAEDGELVIRSDTVFGGYYKDPAATAEVLDADGWLHTGDIAEIDADGFVKITDRKKDIIVTAGGKNIAPQNLENDLKASKYVSQAIVVGDRRPYPAALITLDEVEIGKWAASAGNRRRYRSPCGRPAGDRAGAGHRRRRQPRAVELRADQEVRDPAAGLHDGAGRGDADAEAEAARDHEELRRRRRRDLRHVVGARRASPAGVAASRRAR